MSLYEKLYKPVVPNANYNPWFNEDAFLSIYEKIKGHTLVDIYRCYELWEIVRQCLRLEGDLLEVGVWKGGTGALICKMAELNGGTRKVYLADTFSGVPKAGDRDTIYKGGEHADTSVDLVENLLKQVAVSNYKVLVGIFPEENGDLLAKETFCFCHIDVDVYQSAKDISEWIWPRLKAGGMIVYDDYGFSSCDGVRKFIDERGKT